MTEHDASDRASPSAPAAREWFLINPVAYGDVFEHPLTLAEIERYCELHLEEGQLAGELEDCEAFTRAVESSDGLYYLRGREGLVELRRSRLKASEKNWRLAQRMVGLIRYTPFIEGILVTGSLAVDNALDSDDIDYLVITSPRRLWSVFAVLGTLQRIVSLRYLCPNYYLTIDHVGLTRRSYYVARETLQARPIFGLDACRRFWAANSWVTSFFPNAVDQQQAPGGVLERRGVMAELSRFVEWCLGGWIGDRVEDVLKKILKHRLTHHYGLSGQEVPEVVMRQALEEVELRFHGLKHEVTIAQAFDDRTRRLGPLQVIESRRGEGTQ